MNKNMSITFILLSFFIGNAIYCLLRISYEVGKLMSMNDNFEKLMLTLIKQVMENRQDIESNDSFIYDVAFYTLHSPKLMRMISEKPAELQPLKGKRGSEDIKLAQIIELLALINRIIDHLSTKGEITKCQDNPPIGNMVIKKENSNDIIANIFME